MKKNYKHPRMRAVEIKASSLLSGSGEDDNVSSMSIELDSYDTYTEPIQPRSGNSVQGTGSDF